MREAGNTQPFDLTLFPSKPLRKTSVTCQFTFTLISHLGKTHNHRSREDTPWRAQSVTCQFSTGLDVAEFMRARQDAPICLRGTARST